MHELRRAILNPRSNVLTLMKDENITHFWWLKAVSFFKQYSDIAITLWFLLAFYEQTGKARLIITEIRDEGTFRWLILPTIEIFHLSVFRFRVFRQRKHIFSLIITKENFYYNLLIKLLKSCYTAALVENFVATLPKSFLYMQHIFAACMSTF